MISTADKIKELGFDSDEFQKDVFALNDLFVEKIFLPMRFGDVEKVIYPELRKLNEKYGFFIPLDFTGVDMVRLDKKVDFELFRKELEVTQ